MQVGRLFEMVYLLLERGNVTAKELAGRFEVSERTIYRDVDVLSAAGIPVYTAKGKGGGIRLLPDFVLNKSVLSQKEQENILFGLQSLSAARYPEAGAVLEKLRTFFRKEDPDWIDVDFTSWGSGKEEKERFDRLRGAILSRRQVTFDYVSAAGKETKRTVEPVKLRFKGNSWYLQGYCLTREDYRTFKLIRMRNLQVTEHAFPEERMIDLPIEPALSAIANPLPMVLRFSPAIRHRVYDEFPSDCLTNNEDGSLTARVVFWESEWVWGYLLSFGGALTVLEPEWARKRVLESLYAALENYR